MRSARKVINLEEGWDFMQARVFCALVLVILTPGFQHRRPSNATRSCFNSRTVTLLYSTQPDPPTVSRSDSYLPPRNAQKGIVKLRGILDTDIAEEAFTPQEYMNLYT